MNTLILPANSEKEIILDQDNDNTITIGKNSQVKVIDTGKGNVNIKLEENAHVMYIALKTQSEESRKHAVVGKNAALHWIECYLGGNINTFIRTELQGEASETTIQGVIFGDKENQIQVTNEIIHAASESKSNMLTRIVLKDKAQAAYTGLVKIQPGKKNCQGYQKKETILLSNDARIKADPNLEIENNEVQCSHGATISQLDKEKLFYMTSRGIPESIAKKTIVEGFFNPILEKITHEKIKQQVQQLIAQGLEGVQ